MTISHPHMMWQGAAVAIVGGGPSLSEKDIRYCRERGCRILGVNDAYLFGTLVDVVFFGDCEWYLGTEQHKGHHAGLSKWPGIRLTCDPKMAGTPGIDLLDKWESAGTPSFPFLKWYRNSGASAVLLATMFGARRIYLLGFDGQKRGKHNWHPDNVHANTLPANVYDLHRAQMQQMVDDVKHYAYNPDPMIWNCTPGSAYDCFLEAELKEVLP